MLSSQTPSALYEQDYSQWIEMTLRQLQSRDLENLDWNHLIEEIEDLGREQKNKVESYLTGQCEVFQKISFLYELKPLQALTYTTCKPGPDENHSQTLKPLSDGHSLKNFALSSYLRQLLKHLLLYQYWESEKLYCATGWAEEIDNFRAELEILLRSQTLYNYSILILEPTYQKAKRSAVIKSNLEVFLEICPYRIDEILNPDWLP